MSDPHESYIKWCRKRKRTPLIWDGITRCGSVRIRNGVVYDGRKRVGLQLRTVNVGGVRFAISSKRTDEQAIQKIEAIRWRMLSDYKPRALATYDVVRAEFDRITRNDPEGRILVPLKRFGKPIQEWITYDLSDGMSGEFIHHDYEKAEPEETALETLARTAHFHEDAEKFHEMYQDSRRQVERFWRRFTHINDLLYTMLSKYFDGPAWDREMMMFVINGRHYPMLTAKNTTDLWPTPTTQTVTIGLAGSPDSIETAKTPTLTRRRSPQAVRAV